MLSWWDLRSAIRRTDLNLECPECRRPRGAKVDAIFSADFCTSPSKASGSINELVAHPPTRCPGPGECIRQQRVGSSRWTEEIDCLLSEMAPQQQGRPLLSSSRFRCTYTLRPRAHVCRTTTSNVHCPRATRPPANCVNQTDSRLQFSGYKEGGGGGSAQRCIYFPD